jgi:hypothetical protein
MTTNHTTPVVFTRGASRIAPTHILENVVQRPNINDPFSKASIDDAVGLLTLDDKAINGLVYSSTDSNGVTTTQKLQRGAVGLLRSFIHYVYHHDSTGNPIGNDWLSVTEDMLDEFRTDLTQVYKFNSVDSIHNRPTPVILPAPVPVTPTSLPSQSPVDLFQHGIKRDFASFPMSKDDKQNDQWYHTFSNLARAQDLSDVLDENYTPVTPAYIDLFAEKQKFLYAVLEAKVETMKGKAIIRSHKKKFDAQKAYAELKKYHLTSNTALFSANEIMEYLISARINDGLWHGSVENFIINW